MHVVSKDKFTKKDDIFRENVLSKSCSPDPNNFKTVFEFSVTLLVLKIKVFIGFSKKAFFDTEDDFSGGNF